MIKNFLENAEKYGKDYWINRYNNTQDFVETTEFIMVDVQKNTSFVEVNYRNKLVIVLHFVINDYLQTSFVQYRY